MAVANVDDPSALSHLIAGALRIKTEEKQELLEETDVAKRLRRLSEILARELEVVADRDAHPVAGPVRDRQVPARVRPAPAAQGDPGGAGRERPRRGRGRGPARAARGRARCRTTCARPPSASSRGWRSCRRRPPSTASSAPTSSGSRRCRGTTITEDNLDLKHAREVLDADHYDIERVKDRILEFLAVRKLKPDARGSILCLVGPPGVGKTSLGQVDRRRAGAQVRAHLRRRHARRGRDPRPPPHLHRRDAGRDHPRAARRRVHQPAVHDRRDRQDGLGLPRRPGQRDARGARPRAERHLPRPLPRPAVRPLAGHVRHDGEHARHHPRAAARPHGGHPARRLHRGGEAPDRQALPRPAPDRAVGAEEVADRLHRPRAAHDHHRLHARGRRAQPRARDRRRVPQGRPPGGRGDAGRQGLRDRAAGARAARPPALLHGGASGARASRASRPAWPGRRSAATSCSSRRPRCRARAS